MESTSINYAESNEFSICSKNILNRTSKEHCDRSMHPIKEMISFSNLDPPTIEVGIYIVFCLIFLVLFHLHKANIMGPGDTLAKLLVGIQWPSGS